MSDFDYSIFSAPPPRKPSQFLVRSRKVFGQFVFVILVLLSAGVGALGGLVFVYSSDLPRAGSHDTLIVSWAFSPLP